MTEKKQDIRAELERVLTWANAKLAAGQEPPWAWYQYMKLRETLEAILAGMEATTMEHSPQLGRPQGKYLRLVDSTDPPDSAPHRPAGLPTQTPM